MPMPFSLWGNNLITGLLIGLCVALYVYIRLYLKLRGQKKYWETHLGVISHGHGALEKKLEALEKEKRTLQKNMDALYRKPDRGERHLLYVYEKAIAILMEEYPGFAGVWGRTTRRAEEEMEEAEKGRARLAPRLKKFLGLASRNENYHQNLNLFVKDNTETENPPREYEEGEIEDSGTEKEEAFRETPSDQAI